MFLPSELWEWILSMGGPLAWAAGTGCDARHVAAVRIQRAWRTRLWRSGARVVVRLAGRDRPGTLLRIERHWCVRLTDRKAAYVFLPHPTARVSFVAQGQKG